MSEVTQQDFAKLKSEVLQLRQALDRLLQLRMEDQEHDRDFQEKVRQGELMVVDARERWYKFEPRTAALRKELKALRLELRGKGERS